MLAAEQTRLGAGRIVYPMELKTHDKSSTPRGRANAVEATLSLSQVARLTEIGADDLASLVDYGVLTPFEPQAMPLRFDMACIVTLQRAARLRCDLALDGHAFALAVMFLAQITRFEDELHGLRTKSLARHAGGDLPQDDWESSNFHFKPVF